MTEKLCIPATWIHQANAAHLAEKGDAYAEYHELIAAELYDRAHDILIRQLIPEAVLRDDLGLIERLCRSLEGKAKGWQYGGKVSATIF